jgi:hypothetical protein
VVKVNWKAILESGTLGTEVLVTFYNNFLFDSYCFHPYMPFMKNIQYV